MSVLSDESVLSKLKNLDGWSFENDAIQKEFEAKDFADAVSFFVKIGFEAEKMDHHPDIKLHSWNKIHVTITTHSEGGVTDKDIKLAAKIEEL